MICVRENYITAHIYEHEVARRWYALPYGMLLPLTNGNSCQLLFAGRPGSAAGPDVHDAVLHFTSQNLRRVGDVEFHVRASDWFSHQHHKDARYNNVLLHVVLICDTTAPILRKDGISIAMCSLYDLPAPQRIYSRIYWPCHAVLPYMSNEECALLLKQAGLLRFEQKAHTFVEQLRRASPRAPFSAYDVCLIVALAEGLGYGRNRTFFRATGQYLLGLVATVPEPLGHTFEPPFLDMSRLSVLRKLVKQWRNRSAWATMREATNVTPIDCTYQINQLRTIFTGLGAARADILICNIVLPFAMAVGLIENDHALVEQAQMLYRAYPSLSSNRITRAMSAQLELAGEPEGACQQQGLHYIYQQTCQQKRCEECIVGRRKL
ncbi:MAG: hypothetical protein NVSMB27_01900 [Ktedonobacteraceae bacterium]